MTRIRAAVLLAVFGSLPFIAVADARDFQIEPQALSQALVKFSEQSQLVVTASSDLLAGKTAPPISGQMEPEEALGKLLAGSGLKFVKGERGDLTVVPADRAATLGKPTASRSEDTTLRMAQASTSDMGTPHPTEDSSVGLEEIIVTAQKRQERAQDIPVSIAVIQNQEIERRGLIGMEDYLRSIPGVNQIDVGPQSNAIVIRGITTGPQSENTYGGATVATYFDETPITAAAGLGAGGIDVRPVDIERIEVLRGPQGTSFGDASLGGTLRIIPAKPRLDAFTTRLAASYSDTSRFGSGNSMFQGAMNIPVVTDRFALRAVGYRYEESGFYRNDADLNPAMIAAADASQYGDFVRGYERHDVGQTVSTGGRLAALWQASERLDLSMNLLTQKIEQDGSPSAGIGTYLQARNPIAPQGRVGGEVGELADTKVKLANLVVNYNLGWSTLTSALSWVDGSSVYAQAIPTGFRGPVSSTQPSDFESFTAEARLASHLDGRTQFLGGFFYQKTEDDSVQTLDWPGPPALNPFGTNPMLLFENSRDVDQRAVFGEVSYALSDKVTATLGGRYFEYDKDVSALQEGLSVPIGAGVPVEVHGEEGHSSFKANLRYEPTSSAQLYASWAQGFRLGRPQEAGLAACDTDGDGLVDGTSVMVESTRRVDSDSLDSYEIGAKLALFDRRMTLDASAYHIKWAGLPIGTTAGTCPFAYTANVGSAKSDGLEFQASMLVMDGLRLDFGAGYTKAVLTRDALLLVFPPGLDGDRLPGSPKVNANLSAQYDFTLAGRKAFVHADSFYTGKFYGNFQGTPATEAGDYAKIDARAGISFESLSVELFVRNLTNEDAYTWRTAVPATPLFGYRMRPRTVGIQLGYTFE